MKPQLPEISVPILDYVRYHHNSSSADPPSFLLSVCPIHLAKKPQCLLSSTLCLPHVHTHRVVEAGERPSHLADWTRFKFMTICASRWPLVLVGSDSTFLSTLLACSPRFFYTFFSFWDLSLAPPPFASFSAAFNFTESIEAIRRNFHPLSPSHQPTRRHLYPHTHFSSSHCGKITHVPGSGSAGLCAPSSMPSQIFWDTSSAVIPILLCHQIFPQIGPASRCCFISFCHVTAKLLDIVAYQLMTLLFFHSPLDLTLIRLFLALSLPKVNPIL